MKKLLLVFNIFFFLTSAYSQNVGIGTNTPHASARLEVSSTNSGLLFPRLTEAQRNFIQNPAAGLAIFCTDCGERGEMQYYDGIGWVSMKGGAVTNKLMDASGNTYPTVTIGTQVWMTENLRTTKYRDGSIIPTIPDDTEWSNNFDNLTSSPMMCWYDNDKATYTANKFGALYNWYAINPATNGNKHVCPTGWHVPTDAEWNILIANLDPSYNPSADGIQSATAGGKMKSTGTQYWGSPNIATNSSGWSGLPGGYRFFDGLFFDVGYEGFWWSSTEFNTYNAWFRSLYFQVGDVLRSTKNKGWGYSVRCLKD